MLQHANFLLLDAAIMSGFIEEAHTRNAAHSSLFKGRPEEALSGVAPFLFRYAHSTDFANWYLSQGWGRAWGLLLRSAWPMPELLKHLQSLLRATSEDGQRFIFRFYDPRILRVFLPSCDAKQLREFFGEQHIESCIVEDEDPAYALRFRLENDVLKVDRQLVAEMIASLPEPLPAPLHNAGDEIAIMDPKLLDALHRHYPEFLNDELIRHPSAAKTQQQTAVNLDKGSLVQDPSTWSRYQNTGRRNQVQHRSVRSGTCSISGPPFDALKRHSHNP